MLIKIRDLILSFIFVTAICHGIAHGIAHGIESTAHSKLANLTKLNVVTTTTDLKALVEEVGGDTVLVDSITKGTQDPHYVEAKPSFMVKANRADLIISIGLDLEIGWLPSIIHGARNPKINFGSPGNFEVGPLVRPIDIQVGKLTRADGDVHPNGNPHVLLDPIRSGEIAVLIAKRLGELDSQNQQQYESRAKSLQSRLIEKTKTWKTRIKKSGITQVITYHKTLSYFFDRFELQNPAILEPKPGIPPTSGHIFQVIELIKSKNIKLILIENYFEPSISKKIKEAVPEIVIKNVAVSVDGSPEVKKIDVLYESLVANFEINNKR
jgi:zinc/manganese transport system substrate-binding protein